MKFIHLKSPMLVVFFKEVLENIRDRRTMINALLIAERSRACNARERAAS